MSKKLHLDLVGGLAGDMFSSALSGILENSDEYFRILGLLPIKNWHFSFANKLECGISARLLKLEVPKVEHSLAHVENIAEVIEKAGLPEKVTTDSLAMLDLIANAEATVHGTTVDKIHFHELAGYDLVFDLVSAATLVYLLGVDEITATALPMGHGRIKIAHGDMPLPAPAVLELLKGLPVKDVDIEGETVTPTGAVIARYYVNSFVKGAEGKILAYGIGAGNRENREIPNIVRAILLENDKTKKETLSVLECNIDDMNPEHYDLLFERLFANGALDVWLTPVIMKKNRPANTLSVLVVTEKEQEITELIYLNSTTIGIRKYSVERSSLERKEESRKTEFGPVKGKTVFFPDGQQWIPEYDELKRLAVENNLSIRQISGKIPEK